MQIANCISLIFPDGSFCYDAVERLRREWLTHMAQYASKPTSKYTDAIHMEVLKEMQLSSAR
jgi:hypothetical protein